MMSEILTKYFTVLSGVQLQKLIDFAGLIGEWNQKINLLSRKDIDNIFERHILHSLAIAKVVQFNAGCRILDVGTGGGFPGIPLAILFPEAEFILVDSIVKKMKVVRSVADSLALNNVKTINDRVENIDLKVDFVVARAVTETDVFYAWVRNMIRKGNKSGIPNGLLYLKGLDQANSNIREPGLNQKIYPLSELYEESYFSTKALLYLWKE